MRPKRCRTNPEMSDVEKAASRREFFRGLGRYLTLGLIGVGGGAVVRRRGIDRSEHRCTNKSVCCSCGVFSGCRLPAALSAKERAGEIYRKDPCFARGYAGQAANGGKAQEG